MTAAERPRRGNRVALALLGAVLTAAGVVALLLSTGAIGSIGSELDRDGPVLNEDGESLLSDHELVFQLAGFAVGILLLLAGLAWLRYQFPRVRHHDDHHIRSGPSAVAGLTTVKGRALAEALEGDLRRADQVLDAKVEIRAEHGEIRLWLDVEESARTVDILDGIVSPAVSRFVEIAELEPQPSTTIELRPTAPAARTVA